MKITRHFAVLGSCPTSPIESRPACRLFHSFHTSAIFRFGMQACGPSPCDAIASTKHLLQLGSAVCPMCGLLTVILDPKFSRSMSMCTFLWETASQALMHFSHALTESSISRHSKALSVSRQSKPSSTEDCTLQRRRCILRTNFIANKIQSN